MRIQLTHGFIQSLNSLPKFDRGRAKPYLRAIYNWIVVITDEAYLGQIRLANVYFYVHRGPSTDPLTPRYRLYRYQFEGFKLHLSVSGSTSLNCRYTLIEKIKP